MAAMPLGFDVLLLFDVFLFAVRYTALVLEEVTMGIDQTFILLSKIIVLRRFILLSWFIPLSRFILLSRFIPLNRFIVLSRFVNLIVSSNMLLLVFLLFTR